VIYINKNKESVILNITNHVALTIGVIAGTIVVLSIAVLAVALPTQKASAMDLFGFPLSTSVGKNIEFQPIKQCRNNTACSHEQDVPFVLPFP
jgi:hypothetical protein